MHKKSNDKNNEEEFVITPAGPRSRKKVKQVRPDEVVLRRDDGSYTVVPRKRTTREKKNYND